MNEFLNVFAVLDAYLGAIHEELDGVYENVEELQHLNDNQAATIETLQNTRDQQAEEILALRNHATLLEQDREHYRDLHAKARQEMLNMVPRNRGY
jgi:cell division protein FtsB